MADCKNEETNTTPLDAGTILAETSTFDCKSAGPDTLNLKSLRHEMSVIESKEANSNPRTIQNLPAELHFEIIKLLDPVSSTCLGLTCKKLYPVHKEVHGVVKLEEVVSQAPEDWAAVLWLLLGRWAGERRSYNGGKLVKVEPCSVVGCVWCPTCPREK